MSARALSTPGLRCTVTLYSLIRRGIRPGFFAEVVHDGVYDDVRAVLATGAAGWTSLTQTAIGR